MKNIDFLQGSLSEINMQIVNLMERKQQLLKESGRQDSGRRPAADSSAESSRHFNFTQSPYAAYLQTMQERREPVTNPRIVYQGEPGAYSEAAARNFFGLQVQAVGLTHFDDTFQALAEGSADYAVLPIENSSTGAIRQVYDLLESYSYFFVGETTVRIDHALMALPGTKMEQIETIYSHEQGLFQCEKFLKEHPQYKTIPQADTAGSARLVAKLQDPTKAAICSPLAAEIYGLEILREKLNFNSQNTTRFVVVSPRPELRENRDKICISLTTAHNSGALHNVLTVFAVHGVNLVRLESRPIPEHNWEYMFFIEFTGDLLTREMDTIIHEISLMSGDLRVLGNFRSNLTPQ